MFGQDSEQGQVSKQDSEFSVDLKTNKVKKRTKKKKVKKPPKITSASYKKQRCTHFNKGNCTKGQLCTFSHDFQPDSAKTICKYFLSNACTKGKNCNFSHSTKLYPCKFHHFENNCNQKQRCRFSHESINDKQIMKDFLNDNKEIVMNLIHNQKLNYIVDKPLKKEIVSFIKSQGQIQAELENNNIQQSMQNQFALISQTKKLQKRQQQKVQTKALDPRLKNKYKNQSKGQVSSFSTENKCFKRSWLIQVNEKASEHLHIQKEAIQRFLYSYY